MAAGAGAGVVSALAATGASHPFHHHEEHKANGGGGIASGMMHWLSNSGNPRLTIHAASLAIADITENLLALVSGDQTHCVSKDQLMSTVGDPWP